MDRWMDGWMDGWMDAWMDRWMDGWMDRWMDGRMDGWMDGRMDGCMHGRHMPNLILVTCHRNEIENKQRTLRTREVVHHYVQAGPALKRPMHVDDEGVLEARQDAPFRFCST